MKAYHTLVTGSSGSGKTTLLRQMHAEFNGASAFLTTKENESGVTGKRVRGPRALKSAVQGASDVQDVRVKWYGASYPESLHVVRAWAKALYQNRGIPVQIIVDECQNSGLADSEGPLKEGLHEDRDSGIKWVPATQSPQDLKEQRGYKGINQCRHIVWVGPARTFHSGFLNYYSLDELLPEQDFQYHVIEPSRPPKVQETGTTEQRYS